MQIIKYNNITNTFLEACKGKNGIGFLQSGNSELFYSYNDLLPQIKQRMGFLRTKGIRKGDLVILRIEKPLDFVPCFWASIFSGIIAVPLASGNQEEHIKKLLLVWRDLNRPFIISDDKNKNTLIDTVDSSEKNILSERLIDADKDISFIYDEPIIMNAVPDDIAFIQYSSGSTGSPKGVIVTHRNLLTTISGFLEALEATKEDSFLSWFPLSHDMGLIGWHITPVVAHVNQYLIPTSLFVRRPAVWLRKAAEHKTTIICSPNFGLQHFLNFLKDDTLDGVDLSCIRLLVNGAEPISAKLCDRFLNVLEPYGLSEAVMFPGYGLAEATLAVSVPKPGEVFKTHYLHSDYLFIGSKIQRVDSTDVKCRTYVDEGYPIPYLQLRISDSSGKILDEEYIGEIEICGDGVTSGYYLNEKATKEIVSDDGWVKTGDLGFISYGRLTVTGRLKELIIINGYNYYPQDIERVAEELEEIDIGKIVAIGAIPSGSDEEQLFLFLYAKRITPEVIEISRKLEQHILQKIGIPVSEVIPIPKIPKTTSGKIRRTKLAQDLENGTYDDIRSEIEKANEFERKHSENQKIDNVITINSISEYVINQLMQITGYSSIDSKKSIFIYGVTSLMMVKFVRSLENYLEVSLPLTILSEAKSIDDVISKVNDIVQQGKNQKHIVNDFTFETDTYNLSYGQQSLLYAYLENPQDYKYNISFGVRVDFRPDKNILTSVFNNILRKYKILRTTYSFKDEVPQRVIQDASSAKSEVRFFDKENHYPYEFILSETQRVFDLEQGPVIRLLCFSGESDSILVLNMHHIAGDAASLVLLMEEFSNEYFLVESGEKENAPKTNDLYDTFVAWERELVAKEKETLQTFWLNKLTGITENNEVLMVPHSQRTKHRESGILKKNVDEKVVKSLHELSKTSGISISSILLSVYACVLKYYSSLEDFVVGIPTDIRGSLPEPLTQEKSIGYFINTLPLRITINDEITFHDFMNEIQFSLYEAITHQNYPLQQIIDDLRNNGYRGQTPFSVLFNHIKPDEHANIGLLASPDSDNSIMMHNGNVSGYYLEQQGGLFDLTLECFETDNNISLLFSYRNDTFTVSSINQFAQIFFSLLQNIDVLNTKVLKQICMLDLKSRERILSISTGKRNTTDRDKHFIEIFHNNVSMYPDKPAYIYNERQYTYAEINRKSNGLAKLLLKRNVSKGDLIPLLFSKGIALPVSIIALIKIGAVFVLVDKGNPKGRIRDMILETKSSIVLTDELVYEVDSGIESILIEYENIESTDSFRLQLCNQEESVYAVFTSGTTGVPKCTLNTHLGMINRFLYMTEWHKATDSDSIIHSSNIGFDTTVFELLWMLLNGGTTVIPSGSYAADITETLDLIEKYRISIVNFVPATLKLLVELFKEDAELTAKFESVREIEVGGDVLQPDLIKEFLKFSSKTRVTNIYGPAETAIGVTFYDVPLNSEANIPIGKPINNTSVYVLDKHFRLLPENVIGDIYISGLAVGNGYYNNEEKTLERFVTLQIQGKSVRAYKTGDQGYYDLNGYLHFVGREDEQIKINGIRVEPEEIAQTINQIASVDEAVVIPKKNLNETTLIAFIKLRSDAAGYDEITSFLQSRLPRYMLPADIIFIKDFPISPNGKIDKQKLLLLADEQLQSKIGDSEVPQNEFERALQSIWKVILKTESVPLDKDFFTLGGNSLKIIQLKMKISKSFSLDIPLTDLLNNTTIRKQAAIVSASKNTYENIPKVKQQKRYVTSYAQQRLWFLCQDEKSTNAYMMKGCLQIKGNVDFRALTNSLEKIIDTYEIFRTLYHYDKGTLYQTIDHNHKHNIRFIDEQETTTSPNTEAYYFKSIDINNGPHYSFTLVKSDVDTLNLYMSFHHLMFDGWSLSVFYKKLEELYRQQIVETETNTIVPSIQYKDYSHWEKNFIPSAEGKNIQRYWTNLFAHDIPTLSLRTDFPRPKIKTYNGSSTQKNIDPGLSEGIKRYCNNQKMTPFTLFLSALYILFYKYTSQTKIIIGTPTSGRIHNDLNDQIGFFVNSLPLVNEIQSDSSVMEFIRQTKSVVDGAVTHQMYPFDLMVEEFSSQRDPSRSPLFDIFIAYESSEEQSMLSLPDGQTTFIPFENKTSKFDISFIIKEQEEGYTLIIEYNTDLFLESRMHRLYDHYYSILKTIINKSQVSIANLDIRTKEESKRIIEMATEQESSETCKVLESIEKQLTFSNKSSAVTYEQNSLPYDKLYSLSASLALRIKEIIKDEKSIIPLIVNRSPSMITGIIGVMRAGAAYAPIEADTPIDRMKNMVEQCSAKVIVTDNSNYDFVNSHFEDYTVVNIEELEEREEPFSSTIPDPDDLAYVIFTSGSTGTPKGVMISHASLDHLVNGLNKTVFDTYEDTIQTALLASYSFDASIQQIFPTLTKGGTLHIIPNDVKIDGRKFAQYINEREIVLTDGTPTLLRMIMQSGFGDIDTPTLKHMLIGGEALQTNLIEDFYSLQSKKSVLITNMYGPTECTVDALSLTISSDDSFLSDTIPIGNPLPNTQVILIDNQNKSVPVGVTGELCISGDGLFKGYLSESKNEKMISLNGINNNREFYRTGDLVYLNENYQYVFIKRSDKQVKIRGYRIELQEIKSNILTLPKCSDAEVFIHQRDDETEIVACIISEDESLTVTSVRDHLKKFLPPYMIPASIIMYERFPLNRSGKFDKTKVLNGLSFNNDAPTSYPDDATLNDTELIIANLWSSMLTNSHFSPDDNFFECGGQSLKAIRLVNELNERFTTNLSVADIFLHPTIRTMASKIADSDSYHYDTIKPIDNKDYYELSNAQKRMWILDKFRNIGNVYTIAGALRVKGALNIEKLKSAFEAIIERHEILRMKIVTINDIPYQKTTESIDFWEEVTVSQSNSDVLTLLRNKAIEPFALENGNLLKVALIVINENEYIVLIKMHHIISDGWSINNLLTELSALYSGKNIPPLTVQYKDYAYWMNDLIMSGKLNNQLQFWKKRFEKPVIQPELPTDFPRPTTESYKGGTVFLIMQDEILKKLRSKSIQMNMSVFTLLLTTVSILLHKLSDQQDITIGIPVSGRNNKKLDALIGLFVNTLALRFSVDPESTFDEFLIDVKSMLNEAYNNQEYPFDLLVEQLPLERIINKHALFNVFVSYENNEGRTDVVLDELDVEQMDIDLHVSKFDLLFNFQEFSDKLIIELEYSTDLFTENTAQMFLKYFLTLLNSIIDNSAKAIKNYDFNLSFSNKKKPTLNNPAQIKEYDISYNQDQLVQIEEFIRTLWQEILQINDIQETDNFFDRGGHSLKSIKVMNRINDKYHLQLDLTTIFKFPHINELAKEIIRLIHLSDKKNRSDDDQEKEITI